MDDDTFVITVRLGGESLSMRVKRSEEKIYRDAEKLLKNEYSYLTIRYPNRTKESYYMMMAYEVIASFEKGSTVADIKEVADRLSGLGERIDEALKQ